jgi:hypothetical protein
MHLIWIGRRQCRSKNLASLTIIERERVLYSVTVQKLVSLEIINKFFCLKKFLPKKRATINELLKLKKQVICIQLLYRWIVLVVSEWQVSNVVNWQLGEGLLLLQRRDIIIIVSHTCDTFFSLLLLLQLKVNKLFFLFCFWLRPFAFNAFSKNLIFNIPYLKCRSIVP